MRTSSIAGYFGSYRAAYEAVGKRFKISGKYSIQQVCSDYRMHPWVLIYYGNFV
jgi:hypothetical protein